MCLLVTNSRISFYCSKKKITEKGFQYGTLYLCIRHIGISWSDLPLKISKLPKMSILGLFILKAKFETEVFSIVAGSLVILVFLVINIGVGSL